MLLFGAKAVQRQLPQERKVCPTCLSVTEHTVIDHDTRFTLYFIPLFSLKREVAYTCSQCGDSHVISYDEYRASHPETEPVETRQQGGAGNLRANARKPESARDKARAILEGRVVNGEVKTSLPLSANLTPDRILRWMWIAFLAILLIAAAILAVLVYALWR